MREQLFDKIQRHYYETHSEISQAVEPFDEWLNNLTNMELIELIDKVGGC